MAHDENDVAGVRTVVVQGDKSSMLCQLSGIYKKRFPQPWFLEKLWSLIEPPSMTCGISGKSD